MTKGFAVLALVLAFVAKFGWRIPIDIAIPAGPGLHRGYSLNSILFWILLVTGVLLFSVPLVRRIGS